MTKGLFDLSTRRTEFVDTHCHIHEIGKHKFGDDGIRHKWESAGITDVVDVIQQAKDAGVKRLICVGCSLNDSKLAVELAKTQDNCWASIGIHPHEAETHLDKKSQKEFAELLDRKLDRKIVAIGECGLDYYYNHSDKSDQIKLFEFQLDLANKHDLPVIFHVRESFNEFWPIYDNFKGTRGVIHSFTSGIRELEQALSRDLYVGLNGIVTFTKNDFQINAVKQIPLDKMLLETDAPYLTPAPQRGTICQPKHLRVTAEYIAGMMDITLEQLAQVTTQNACNLFGLKQS